MSGKAIRVEAIAFFNRYPQRQCTCEDVAEMLQRKRDEVEPQLESLVRLGLLDRFEDGRTVFYRAKAAYTGSKTRHSQPKARVNTQEAAATGLNAAESKEVSGGRDTSSDAERSKADYREVSGGA